MTRGRKALALAAIVVLSACGDEHRLTSPSESAAAAAGRRPSGDGPVLAIVDLGFYVAADIDEQGRAVGWDLSNGVLHARLWTPAVSRGTTGTTTSLSEPNGGQSFALGLNQVQQIAGGRGGATSFHATVWDGTSPHFLTEPAGTAGSDAQGITDQLLDGSRLVVGRIDFPEVSRAGVWRTSGTGVDFSVSGMDLLPGLRPAGPGQAIAVNAGGLVVGDAVPSGSSDPNPVEWSFSGSAWSVTPLGLLPNQSLGQALDVNANGVAVGHNASGTGCNHGAVWLAPTQSPIGLQDLAGGTCTFAWAINDGGQITGSARDAGGRTHAVLWVPSGGGNYSILKLGELRGTLSSEGRGLNEALLDGSGGQVLEVVGSSGSRGTLWKVRLP